eukprot:TRINITY_DN7869_c0_g1_i1.p1 TRINITY_DN7869_c0_g1~~TRINITY_DN7869_c0_g1_i1.p1  ORF type:complete len:252 (-),score=13.26 TRINITY_DN7869_c0_g1_i1:41-766(-)
MSWTCFDPDEFLHQKSLMGILGSLVIFHLMGFGVSVYIFAQFTDTIVFFVTVVPSTTHLCLMGLGIYGISSYRKEFLKAYAIGKISVHVVYFIIALSFIYSTFLFYNPLEPRDFGEEDVNATISFSDQPQNISAQSTYDPRESLYKIQEVGPTGGILVLTTMMAIASVSFFVLELLSIVFMLQAHTDLRIKRGPPPAPYYPHYGSTDIVDPQYFYPTFPGVSPYSIYPPYLPESPHWQKQF